ncbi:MAG: HAMP domain-containing histidine kinase [Leptospiraceae bacterium]|nr:HAMP domain-containing histidine kinase [Leptospiraceae bacterium]
MSQQNSNLGIQLTFNSLAEEKIKELQAIIDGITEPLILINQNFDIKRVNHVTLSFSDEEAYKDIIGKKCYTKLYGRENICPYCPFVSHKMDNSDFSDVFDTSSFPIPELKREVLFKFEGKNQNLNLTFFPLIDKEGKIHSFVEKISNITRIKEKEEENLRMRNLASLGIMISGVAHEINNPLTGISLTVQNLVNNLNHFAPDVILNRLDLIQKDLARAALIVSDIISFAKPERSKYTLADILEVIYKAKETVQRLYPDLSKNVTWDINADDEYIFYFNPFKIERLFLNLFRNSLQAFDYTRGYIRVDVKKKKNSTVVTIEDNAGGIPENVVDKIFDPFFSNRKEGSGTGLGLSICHSIVKDHNGKINVKSTDDRTKFSISLPTIKSQTRL